MTCVFPKYERILFKKLLFFRHNYIFCIHYLIISNFSNLVDITQVKI